MENGSTPNREQCATQFRQIADRLTAIATIGLVEERWREHQIQVQQAGGLLVEVIKHGWIKVDETFSKWVAQVLHDPANGSDNPLSIGPLIPRVRIFNVYVDTYFIRTGSSLVRPEPGGLSAFSNVGMTAEQQAALLGGRLQTVADACRAIADDTLRMTTAGTETKTPEISICAVPPAPGGTPIEHAYHHAYWCVYWLIFIVPRARDESLVCWDPTKMPMKNIVAGIERDCTLAEKIRFVQDRLERWATDHSQELVRLILQFRELRLVLPLARSAAAALLPPGANAVSVADMHAMTRIEIVQMIAQKVLYIGSLRSLTEALSPIEPPQPDLDLRVREELMSRWPYMTDEWRAFPSIDLNLLNTELEHEGEKVQTAQKALNLTRRSPPGRVPTREDAKAPQRPRPTPSPSQITDLREIAKTLRAMKTAPMLNRIYETAGSLLINASKHGVLDAYPKAADAVRIHEARIGGPHYLGAWCDGLSRIREDKALPATVFSVSFEEDLELVAEVIESARNTNVGDSHRPVFLPRRAYLSRVAGITGQTLLKIVKQAGLYKEQSSIHARKEEFSRKSVLRLRRGALETDVHRRDYCYWVWEQWSEADPEVASAPPKPSDLKPVE